MENLKRLCINLRIVFKALKNELFYIRVLESLAGSGCATVLTYLDVESSPHVDDACLDFITRFNHVEV